VEGALGLETPVALTRGRNDGPGESDAGNGSRLEESARDSTATPHVVENAAAVGPRDDLGRGPVRRIEALGAASTDVVTRVGR